jgi:hypothetical protein
MMQWLASVSIDTKSDRKRRSSSDEETVRFDRVVPQHDRQWDGRLGHLPLFQLLLRCDLVSTPEYPEGGIPKNKKNS